MASLCDANAVNLRFFNGDLIAAPYIPRTVDQIIDVAQKTHARGMTTNAAGLHDVYEAKDVYETVLMITDECENGHVTTSDGQRCDFNALFKLYRERVCPTAKLVFVSFVSQSDPGQMFSKIKSYGGADTVRQFRLDPSRPDLTRLDGLLGMLSSEGESFKADAQKKLRDSLNASKDGDDAAAPAASSSSTTAVGK